MGRGSEQENIVTSRSGTTRGRDSAATLSHAHTQPVLAGPHEIGQCARVLGLRTLFHPPSALRLGLLL